MSHTGTRRAAVGPAKPRGDVPSRVLIPFFALTFIVAWGLIALLAAAPDSLERILGPARASHPFFILAVWTPALVALPIVAVTTGADGLRRYLSRVLRWRAPLQWYAFLVLGIPALFFAGAALAGTMPALDYPAVGVLLQTAAFMAVLGPVEEFGWRGLALPILQRRLSPLAAGTLLGVIWGIWHLPAFVLSGTPQSGWAFFPFFIGTTGVSVILTVLFNHSRGSILLAGVYHYQLINPLWPDAQPYDMYLFAAVAGVVVWLARESMLTRGAGITEVAPPAGSRVGVPVTGRGTGREAVDSSLGAATGAHT